MRRAGRYVHVVLAMVCSAVTVAAAPSVGAAQPPPGAAPAVSLSSSSRLAALADPRGGPLLKQPATIGGSNGFTPLVFTRLLDTRSGRLGALEDVGGSVGVDIKEPLAAGVVTRFDLNVLPDNMAGLALNITAIAPSGNGNLKAYGCASLATAQPNTAWVNFQTGLTAGNSGIASPDVTKGLCLVSTVATDVAIDTNGYMAADSGYSPVAPVRLLDTRPVLIGTIEESGGSVGTDVAAPLAANVTQRFVLPLFPLALNVTAVTPSGNGFLVAFPCVSADQPAPATATVNYLSGVTSGNGAIISPDIASGGGLCLRSSQTTHVTLDLNGEFIVGFTPLTPARLLDTRAGLRGTLEQLPASDITVPLTANQPARFVVTNTAGVPVTIAGVALNATAIAPPGNGFLTVYRCDSVLEEQPATSSLNYRTGVTRGNLVMVAPADNGGLCLLSSQSTNVTLDVTGYFVDVLAL